MYKFQKRVDVDVAFNENEEIKIDVTITFTRKDDAVTEAQQKSTEALKNKIEKFLLDQLT